MKGWLAGGLTPLVAVKVKLYVLATAVVPTTSTPVAALKVTPVGSGVTVSAKVGGGVPVAVTVKVPPVPAVNKALLALVIFGASSTVSVKVCVALVSTPLLAVMVKVYVPPVVAAGTPLSVAVPLPLSVKVTLLGNAALPSLRLGLGKPLVVTVKAPALPTVNVVALALVIDGASSTVSVKVCVEEAELSLLAAVMVMI